MTSLSRRIASSFKASFGDIVFGMEDGTVSIFGLVFGVAASTSDARVVLVAGMTGAIAAAVSMMAGAYLDAETARDQARALGASHDAKEFDAQAIAAELRAKGIAPEALDALVVAARAYPGLPGALRAAYRAKAEDADTSPLAHALWMFAADLLAALVPVLPFAFLPMETARYVSLAATAAVLIALGIGRAKIGKRRLLPTTLQTLAIAAAAGLAGVLVGYYFA
ncbi:MAG: VIT1/CCC1 transporter family protein [Burkholderiales bacterium]|nr:VIT1/CCC1 transporter family protein [Burkholderiales bacterium]